jgi:hypothetical protein
MLDPWQRFIAHTNIEDAAACWRWTASVCRDGYAKFYANRKYVKAHNYAYREIIGEIPEGLVLDHLCRVRNCVNPFHLEPVTNLENIRRGENKELKKKACPRGHPYDRIVKSNGKRRCRTCDYATRRRMVERKRWANISF